MTKGTLISFCTFLLFSYFSWGNIVGSDAQNFNPTTSGLDYITVHSSETLTPGVLNFGLFWNHAVNTLPYFPNLGDGVSQSRGEFNDQFTAVDFNFGLGLAKNWDVGMSFPFLVNQSVSNTDGVGLYREGLMEIRANTKYRFFGDSSKGLAAIFSVNLNRIKNNPFAGSGAGPTYNIELAADRTVGAFSLGANIGYRQRSPGDAIEDIGIDPLPSQYLASLATNYQLKGLQTKLVFEIYSSFPAESVGSNQTDREASAVEFLGGAKYDYDDRLALHFGGGTELIHGASAPDWRAYFGLNWATGPHWRAKKKTPQVREIVQEVAIEPSIEPEPLPVIEQIRLLPINFITSTATVAKGSQVSVEEMVKDMAWMLEEYDVLSVVVEGHTDSIGREEVNEELSQFRADTIKNILVERTALDDESVEAIGYGESQPIDDNGNFQGRLRNRRVELKVRYRPRSGAN